MNPKGLAVAVYHYSVYNRRVLILPWVVLMLKLKEHSIMIGETGTGKTYCKDFAVC